MTKSGFYDCVSLLPLPVSHCDLFHFQESVLTLGAEPPAGHTFPLSLYISTRPRYTLDFADNLRFDCLSPSCPTITRALGSEWSLSQKLVTGRPYLQYATKQFPSQLEIWMLISCELVMRQSDQPESCLVGGRLSRVG